jgi:hypothetical protein
MREYVTKSLGFLTSLLRRFDRGRPITLDSDKTHGNSVHWLVCRKTRAFLEVRMRHLRSLNGHLMGGVENARERFVELEELIETARADR